MFPKYMEGFKNEMQFMIIQSLKLKGSIFKKGKFTISKQVDNYIITTFKVTKGMQLSNILHTLTINQSTVNNLLDLNQNIVSNLKIRLGWSRRIKYTTPRGSSFTQTANSFIY